ncbi:S-layer protein, partial [Candidatus Bathyarchaeota archaeon]|nr:S-layer protein [Candidatus Bathyarchaeota archaeon]
KKQDSSLNATLAYKNPAKGNKVIYDSSKLVASGTASEPMTLTITFDASTYTLKLANKTAAYTAVGDYDPTISLLGYDKNVTGNFKLEGTVTTPSVKLGSTRASVDTNDTTLVPYADISSQETDIVYDTHGTKIKTVKTNVLSDQLVFSLPADTVKVKIAVGKIEAVAGAGGTYNKIVPIRTAVSKLDTDADVATLKTTSHLVLVGGPCVNDLVAELAAAGKLKDKDGVTLTCEGWPGRNFGVISAIEDAFVPGKIAVVVAGTRADDTRAACAAAQKFEDYLSTVTTSSVEVGGTVTAPGPVTPY